MDCQDERAQTPIEEESKILERVARIISSVRGAKPDYAHLAAELEPALPFDIFGIVLLRHDREAVRITICQREEETWVAHYHQHPLSDSMVERMLSSLSFGETGDAGKEPDDDSASLHQHAPAPLLVENFPAGATGLPAECGDALCGNPRLRAVLIAPLLAGGKMLGTLELGSTLQHAYADPALQRVISALASLLATAIEGAQVGGNVEIQDRQRAELKDVSTVLATAVDLPMILQRIVLGITNALHVSSAIVRLDQGRLRLEAQSGLTFDPGMLQALLDVKHVLSERAIIGSTLLSRQPRVSQDIAQDERFPQSQGFASELGVHSLFCYPLITGQSVYGALLLLSSEPGGFTPLKTDIFSLFAGQATVAIHNGMLLQSAQERRRFQEIIEQLERAQQQNVFLAQDEADETALLKRLRAETMDTFGVSLSSVLRFISDHLLSRSERHLQEILQASQNPRSLLDGEQGEDASTPDGQGAPYKNETRLLEATSGIDSFAASIGTEGTLALMQAAETALARTDFLRDVSAALMRVLRIDEAHPHAYEQLKRELAEPWFIVDDRGLCVYLNRAAELFCGISARPNATHTWQRWPEESSALFSSFRPLGAAQDELLTLEQTLAPLLPRMRQLQDMLAYLRDFLQVSQKSEAMAQPALLRCILAAEALPGQAALSVSVREVASAGSAVEAQVPRAVIGPPNHKHVSNSPSMLLDSSPSDRHYQFIRHALYNEYGQWFAYALHVHDITEQVRDEKNKAVLLASVSHDLRTPLTVIKAAVTGLMQPGVTWNEKIRREILEDINTETDHLNTLVNSLVEMSQIEMGALILDKEWCDIAEIVHTTLTRFQRMLADFTISTCIHSPLPLISADYVQLERVLRNLLENATRYSPKDTEIRIVVDVLAQKALPPGIPETCAPAVRIQVIDQGPGIPEEERERIFKSFYGLDLKGNGLGLAICRGIIEAHQGHIWIEDASGGGSCFVFVLPITS